jgi:D-serine deaminase-like pyridoxal phosphate-dependent protein
MKVNDIPTPAFLVDLQKVDKNTMDMINIAKSRGITLRPHVKTHKTLEVARYQTRGHQCPKIVVSTLAEARFFARGGFEDILYGVPLSPAKVDYAYELTLAIPHFHVFIDNKGQYDAMLAKIKSVPSPAKKWSVFLKVDCGYHRAGVDPDTDDSLELAKFIAITNAQYSELQGIYSHSGHSYRASNSKGMTEVGQSECNVISAFAKKLIQNGIPCPVVSIGSTPVCCHLPPDLGLVNEIHPGNYVYFDRMQVAMGTCKEDDVAATVLVRVIGHYPGTNHMLVDAGSLALSSDCGAQHCEGGVQYGSIKGHPNMVIERVTQEVGKVVTRDGSPIKFDAYPLGSTLQVLPNHSCLTAAMFGKHYVISGDEVVDEWIPDRGWY